MKKVILLLILKLIIFSAFAQKKDTTKNGSTIIQVVPTPTSSNQAFPFLNTIPPSPEAASLGRYGEIPVSLSTGTASFEVPIYEVISGSLKVPVKLSYHSGGVKVNDIASSVGTGFSLLAGGAITRVVKGGLWDECELGILHQVIPEVSNTADFNCFLGNLNTTTDYVDGMPDDFFYNINGLSGKFLYNNRTTANLNITPIPITYPHSNLKINWVSESYFTVMDVDGTLYKFEDLETTVLSNTTTARNNPCGTTYTSAWYLTQMISANRIDSVSFSYTSSVRITSSPIWSTTLTKEVNSFGAKTFTYSYAFQRSDVNSILLSEINYKNGKVTFTYANDREDQSDGDAKRLTTISIYQKDSLNNSNKLKHFALNQSYFTCDDGRSEVDQPLLGVTGHSGSFLLKRLRLDSVTEVGTDNSTLPPFSFNYYEDQPLAIYGALAQDYWGYSNNATSNTNLLLWNTDLSHSAEPSPTYGANCSPNFNYAVSGALKRITYPTGGHSVFSYESNTVSYLGSTIEGGGIRIKKIVNHDNNGNTTQTSYNYISPYITNSVYTGSIDDNIYYFTTEVKAEDNAGSGSFCVSHFITVYPEKISIPLGADITSVAQEEVEEYKENGLGSRLGKKKYTYSTSIDPSFVEFPMETVSASWKRGLLLNEKTYSILPDSSEVLIQEQKTAYTELSQPYKTRGYIARLSFNNDYYNGFCQITGSTYCSKYSIYNQYVFAEKNEQSSVFLPTQTITNTYDQNGLNAVKDTLTYNYNTTNLQLTKTTSRNSDGHVFETITRYPHDFSGTAVYDTMVNRHIFSPIIETELKENGTSIKKVRTNYKRWYPATSFGGVSGFLAPLSVEKQEYGGSMETEVMMGESLNSPAMEGYDVRSRPVLYTGRSGLTTQFEWWNTSGKKDLLKKKITNNLTTEFDYEPNIGIKKITAPNGVQNSFFYDAFERLSATQDHHGNVLTEYEYHYGSPNKVTTKLYVLPTTGISSFVESIPYYTTTHTYFDGLGRTIQTVGQELSPKGKDVVIANQNYDAYGRLDSQLTIFPTENDNGAYVSNGLSLAQTFHKDIAPFTKTIYESSPFSRPRSQFGLGNAWHSMNKKMQLFDETAGSDVRYYTIDATGNITLNGSYASNNLYKKRVIDEQGNTIIEITDKKGQLIQRQQQNGADVLTTYYIYDGLGRVLAILQPNAFALNSSISQSSSNWTNGVFFYKYDTRDRAIENHVPNGGFNYNVYDKADRLVLSQDAHQHTLNLWSFTKYDGLSREILSGELINANSRSTLQSQFDSHTTLSETFDSSKPEYFYYTNNSFPISGDSSNAMQVNYYDSYNNWRSNSFLPLGSYYTNAQGLLTGVRKRYTENKKWLIEAYYHDTKDRVIESAKQNLQADIEHPLTNYRLQGSIDSYSRIYAPQYFGAGSITYVISNIYGRGERKNGYTLSVLSPSNTLETNVEYSYNEIGQLITKKFEPNRKYEIAVNGQDYINRPPALDQPNTQDIANKAIIISNTFVADSTTETYTAEIDTTHSNGLVDALQTINYDYHIRGQLKCINCRNKQARPDPKENDLFSMKLAFEDDKRYYDGNISYQSWKTPIVAKNQQYKYVYDGLSRLTKAAYGGGVSGSNYSLDTMRYDQNGNILQLKRHTIDDLSYTYNGNQLLSVSDGGTTAGFNDGNTSGNDYEYWANGALMKDKNKGIDSIVYNSYLKKVSRVKFTNGNWINFYYDAIGTLLKRKLSNGDTWIYRDDLLMKNDTLYQINHNEGRVIYDRVNQKWLTEFHYRDHLGNLRLSFRDSLANPVSGVYKSPVVTQINDYDPTGIELQNISFQNNKKNNFKFNSIENIKDFNLDVNQAFFRTHDPQISRMWQIDTKPNNSISLYAAINNNPVRFIDPLGDTTVVNNGGKIVSRYGKDNSVFLKSKNGQLESLGVLGQSIKFDKIMGNILSTNKEEAKKIGFLGYYKKVKTGGDWDYKNRKDNILGLATSFDNKNGTKTNFTIGSAKFTEAADFGNFNAGYTGRYTNGGQGFAYSTLLFAGGVAQTMKDFSDFKIMKGLNELSSSVFGGNTTPPFGDEPDDFIWNTTGMKYADIEKKKP